jgi:hypothetical protein
MVSPTKGHPSYDKYAFASSDVQRHFDVVRSARVIQRRQQSEQEMSMSLEAKG